jgi:hypothetical protein
LIHFINAIIPKVYAEAIVPNTTTKSIPELIISIITYFNYLISGLALLSVVYAGFLFMTAGGNPDQLTKAKKSLLYALLGIFIIAATTIIINSLDKFVDEELISLIQYIKFIVV